jgi:predicted DNA-binding protein (MmcQ/YjbR family)
MKACTTMSIDAVRTFCLSLPAATEDIKWGSDLVFSVGGKMFAVVNTERPHTLSFKCTPEMFAELTERDGIIPAPYLARAMWVQERSVGDVLDRREMEELLRTAYDLVVSTLPKSKRPGASLKRATQSPSRRRPSTRSRGASSKSSRRGRSRR